MQRPDLRTPVLELLSTFDVAHPSLMMVPLPRCLPLLFFHSWATSFQLSLWLLLFRGTADPGLSLGPSLRAPSLFACEKHHSLVACKQQTLTHGSETWEDAKMPRCQDGGTTGSVSAKDQVLMESASQLGYCEVKGLATFRGPFTKALIPFLRVQSS